MFIVSHGIALSIAHRTGIYTGLKIEIRYLQLCWRCTLLCGGGGGGGGERIHRKMSNPKVGNVFIKRQIQVNITQMRFNQTKPNQLFLECYNMTLNKHAHKRTQQRHTHMTISNEQNVSLSLSLTHFLLITFSNYVFG